jgi:hypothetical protein
MMTMRILVLQGDMRGMVIDVKHRLQFRSLNFVAAKKYQNVSLTTHDRESMRRFLVAREAAIYFGICSPICHSVAARDARHLDDRKSVICQQNRRGKPPGKFP